MPKLSVIIVNYNGGALVRECLEHLWPQLTPEHEVFVVDNNSSDGSAGALAANFGALRVISNRSNVGYARANNQAIAHATGSYILLLNPDTHLGPGAIANAVNYLERNRDVSILGAKVLRPDGRLDPPARRSFKTPATYLYKAIGLWRLFPHHRRFGRYYLSYLDENQVADVDSVVGAFLMIRRTVVERIGPLDERFFMYCEDEDWCWRAKQAGGRVVYHPGVVVHHVKGASTSRHWLRMAFHFHRSLWLFHRKNAASRYVAPINWIVYGGIAVGLAGALATGGARWLALTATNRIRRWRAFTP
jgi:GT2 family glycosyltransferase